MKLRIQQHNFSIDSMIKYHTVKYKYHYPSHIHQFAELVIPTKGELTVTVNGESEKFGVGQAVFILPFQPHSYDSDEYNELEMFVFSPSLIPEIYNTRNGMLQKNAVFSPEKIAFSIFEERIFGRKNFDSMEIKGALYIMLNNFIKTVELTQVTKYHDVSLNIIKYVSAHYTEKITVNDVAKAIGYTPNYVSSIVNRVFGESLASVVAAVRLDRAMYLLCNTDKSCYSIGYECGFGSEQDFYRKFKALIGKTPNEYRLTSKINKFPNPGVVKRF